jgi:hypothetical protein
MQAEIKNIILLETLWRFCGWNPVHRALESHSIDSTSATGISGQQPNTLVTLRIQCVKFATMDISLLDLCAQELFTTLMMSLASVLTIDDIAIVEKAGTIQLENATVGVFAKAFEESGLGSYSDALLCLIPALRNQMTLVDSEDMLSALVKAGGGYRRKSEWERAEVLLRWACARFSSDPGTGGNTDQLFVGDSRTQTSVDSALLGNPKWAREYLEVDSQP